MHEGENRYEDDELPGNIDGDNGAGDALETEQLAFAEEDSSLPWLESGDDEEYNEYSGSDTGRILGFLILGLISLAAIVGGIWWATHRNADPALVADGSTINPPAEPIKEAPKDPGGKQFEGTGDTSFAVSEGQNRPARLGQEGGVPAPSVDLAAKPAVAAGGAAGASAASGGAAAAASGGVGVQVGAFRSREKAEEGWSKLAGNPALSGVRHRVIEGQADIGTVFRLQAVAGDAAAANALCSRLKASGVACQVKN